MRLDTVLDLAGLGLRAAEAVAGRLAPGEAEKPDTRVDKLVRRALPVAEKVLDRVSASANGRVPSRVRRRAEKRGRRRRGSALGLALGALVGAAAAGSAAYLVVRQRQRIEERYRPTHVPFRPELLDVLAAPGGGGRLDLAGQTLLDRKTGAEYALLDGIPDFIAPLASVAETADEESWIQDLIRPIGMWMMGRNHAGNAAFASAVALAGSQGWLLSAPAGRGTYEVEMARANPQARVLCVSNNWDVLLEGRRRANLEGVANLYFARGTPRLLPVQDQTMAGVWISGGLHRYPRPERELTQIMRAARPGAAVAGVSLVFDGPPVRDALLRLSSSYLPGLRDPAAHLALLEAVGLKDLRLARDGAFVRFSGVKAVKA
jgi:hypothetical protein